MHDSNARNRLAAARIARATSLANKSPRERGDEKMRIALDWIYRWGWAAPSTLDLIAGTTGRGLGSRLLKRGLLVRTRTQSGGGQKGVPGVILTLSQLGLEEIERTRDTLLVYELDRYRTRQDQLRHYQLTQAATARNLKKDAIQAFMTEKELAAQSRAGIKQPDAVWVLQSGAKVAVEVELSAKWARDLDQFIAATIQSLSPQADGDGKPRFDMAIVASDSPAIVRRYKAAFQPGSTYQEWGKDVQRRWVVVRSQAVPAWLEGKVICQLLAL